MKNYRLLIEYKVPNSTETYYKETFIQSRYSPAYICDQYVAQDCEDLIRSVEVAPV